MLLASRWGRSRGRGRGSRLRGGLSRERRVMPFCALRLVEWSSGFGDVGV